MELRFPFFQSMLLLWVALLLLLLPLQRKVKSESFSTCSEGKEDSACLETLVAKPSETSCDGSPNCRLHFLQPEEQSAPEEVKDTPQDRELEFKQVLKEVPGDEQGNSKQQTFKNRNALDRLHLVETSLLSMTARFESLRDESRHNLSQIEEKLSSLVVFLLGMLTGCELSCNESVQKLSVLVSRTVQTFQVPEMWQLLYYNFCFTVNSSEKMERTFPRDCGEIYKQGIRDNGIYTIQPLDLKMPFEAYCDMATDEGGWTVFQRRQDGSVDFNRTWQEYKQGFGSLQGEHWLGNERLHGLTRLGQHSLRIELEDWYGVKRHAIYKKFKVASEQHKYRLIAREYQGNAGNALSYSQNYNHDHKYFSTFDSDNDNYPVGNCGAYYGAGWWFDSCLAANLNGRYHRGLYSGVTSGIYWGTWYILTDKRTNQKYSFKRVEMKTRVVNG
uniref:Fibroleukin-like n=1 Tax=Geotrypetes seraphini TaxID=260995 RepID=A0A6P8Q602_GEOSA|nr:fibroleukin-like [Geotrypetes seraphini]